MRKTSRLHLCRPAGRLLPQLSKGLFPDSASRATGCKQECRAARRGRSALQSREWSPAVGRIRHTAHCIDLTGDPLRKPRHPPAPADGEGRDRRAPPEPHRHLPGKPAAHQRDGARSRPACPGPSYGVRGRPPPRHDPGGLPRRHGHLTRKTPRGDTPPRPASSVSNDIRKGSPGDTRNGPPVEPSATAACNRW